MYNDGNLTFEGLMVVFASFSTYLQYLNIYRSVWWLPNSNYTSWVKYLHTFCYTFIYNIISLKIILISFNLTHNELYQTNN
jgi:hypothetical protein